MSAFPSAGVQPADTGAGTGMHTDPKLLELLVCPLTRTALSYDAARQELISRAAGLAFPIRNGVPMMTADAARTLDDESGPRRTLQD